MKKTGTLKNWLIPVFCLTHMSAIFWWTLPQSYGSFLTENSGQTLEAKLLTVLTLADSPHINKFFQRYIDVTGSQQYWDFFAPQSPKVHQYLSVCTSINAYTYQEKIECKGKPLFSNLESESGAFRLFGSDRSRLYRLTENLAKLEDPGLLKAFARYYQTNQLGKNNGGHSVSLVLHQFELHPELNDLPKSGYRIDKLLLKSP